MEGPAGLLKAYFLDELVGALNKRLNIPVVSKALALME